MVMEAATISSPQRKLNVVPVQKSLSLPSYARAGGEGIDHRIIFAALEQKEKVRRKSRIFAREKSARQNIFCLPISSGNKCRETSLSSDTSCSSLEYQKPKSTPKSKKDEKKPVNEITVIEIKTAKTNQPEVRSNQSQNVEPKTVEVEYETQKNSLKFEPSKGHRSPSDTLRLNVNSSDSMERSSRSSNDSLSRKERLVAIKAKVEAAREKMGDTSSEDENQNSITRYNSDGVIHRSVREVKSRSYRMEKRLRRRSQDEYGLKKAYRKNNLSLCLNSLEDGIKLDLDRSLNIFDDTQNTECKTDFCPSPNMLDFTKKSYFSDFPSRENVSRSVQARVRHIEEEERKRRNSSDLRDKIKISSRQSPQNTENSSPFSTQRRNAFSNQNVSSSLEMEKSSPCSDVLHCSSPVGRAPTPPPRSPKSITFVNKVYKQHQNSYLNHDSHSLERKHYFQPNIPVTSQPKPTDKVNCNDSKTCFDLFEDTKERRKMRELFNARRKTCSYFDYTDNYALKELNSSINNIASSKSPVSTIGLNIPQSTETKGYISSSETPCSLSEDPKRRFWRTKWDETERRQEFMFNSLESKKKSPSWIKWSEASQEKEQCLCQIVSGSRYCSCSNSRKIRDTKISTSSSVSDKIESTSKNINVNNGTQSFRLSKSEVNIAYADQTKPNSENILRDSSTFRSLREKQELTEKNSATANLDSAMEELESVYRSLKFSNDNLSVKDSTSNLSLNDLNAETSKNHAIYQKTDDLHFKQSSTRENNFNLYNNKLSNSKIASDKKPLESLKLSVYSPTAELNIGSLCKSPESESICIDELFNDLTRQLDIEQKLLKESRENRQENKTPDLQNRRDNRTFDFQAEKSEKRDQKRMTPLESIVSIRKELFDNLQKNSQEQMRSYSPGSKLTDKIDSYQLEMAKKKYKAARSLSENISYLMASSNPNPIVKKIPIEKTESCNSNMEFILEKSTPKQYEHIVLEPHKIENRKDPFFNHPVVPKRTYVPDKHKKPIIEEIRQIRVSMDTNSSDSANILTKEYGEYPRLTSAVCRPQLSPKTETSPRLPPRGNSPNPCRDSVDVLDENGLEKLLNTLLNDVPDPKQSSLMKSREDAPPTPPPVSSPGKSDHVKFKRNILPLRMDAYMAAATKGQVKTSDCGEVLKSEEITQVKNDFHQSNAHLNQVSFIPIYASKNVCHKYAKVNSECENQSDNTTCERKNMSTYSPPTRPRCTGDKEMLSARIAKTHMRRRSVGFEDMTSLTSYYGHNFTNDRRFQGTINNSNISQESTENHSTLFQSDNAQPTKKLNQRENSCFSSWNHNAQISSGGNANDEVLRRLERPLQQYKDKSSKRKSSLNRMDFIHFSPKTGSTQYPSDFSQKNSSSDEEGETRYPMKRIESPIGTSKRKHSGSNTANVSPKPEVKTREVTLKNSSSKMKSNLPKSSPINHSNSRPVRWNHSSKIRFSQKLSHSAGELESLTDFSEVPNRNKTYMSAQEFDDQACSRITFSSETLYKVSAKNKFQKSSPKPFRKNDDSLVHIKNACDNTSQIDSKNVSTNHGCSLLSKDNSFDDLTSSTQDSSNIAQPKDPTENISNEINFVQTNPHNDSINSDLQKDCDSNALDVEIGTSAIKIESLNITDSNSKSTDVSADESGDAMGSDGERRRGSILRKKSSEERRELHSILKQPPEEKLLKTPPSILKHRESSEEKDSWQPNDLHSILKKSTSEDESCNSGSDIRPILKLSTDEDSPSGILKPRPILKKRTSFSDECSYVSFPSGELKPILKKKTPLSSEEQPKPILKSRRKSEDSKSTSEIITSRPRAYSADMGVKKSHESQNDSSDIKKDFCKLDSHDL